MKKLTDQELKENDITIYIPEGAILPEEIRNYLALYIGTPCRHKKTKKAYTKYTLPAYQVRQWLKEYSHLLNP